ncbi:MAG: AraC family transcriptional regulator [Lachnospiraceae bacterium]|nr:AraC family transcriptional regulator [Lachnospiraceae bacterium]
MFDLDVMPDASEIIHYDTIGIPLYIRELKLSAYPDMRALCHWHEDIEWIRIVNGNMNYEINGNRILLQKDDCLMINSRQMHYGFSQNYRECDFLCILFHPQLLTGFQPLYQQYVQPITENQHLEYLHYRSGSDAASRASGLLDRIVQLKKAGNPAFEMEIIGTMHFLWGLIFKSIQTVSAQNGRPEDSEIALQKTMVSYIYQHYMEKITLNDIASAGNVCRSKCCSIFRHYLRQSPIDFLNAYRLKVSCHLLAATDTSITEIALSCGFNHLSYFSKLFLRCYGCTPRDYRNQHR